MTDKSSTNKLFLPGQDFTIRPEWRRTAQPQYTQALVYAPGRVHFCVFDFSKMGPGLGGGGLGVSTSTAVNKVLISRKRNSGQEMTATTQHLVQLFKELVNYADDDIFVDIQEKIKFSHAGLGSNVSLNTAVIAGLNALFGSPFSVENMWDIITRNYVENATDGQSIYRGLDTGVGEACLLYGGLVWIAEGDSMGDGRYIGNLATDGLWIVTAVGDIGKLSGDVLKAFGENADMSGKTESEVVTGKCNEYQRKYGAALHTVLHRMRADLLRNDLRGLLATCWDMSEVGNIKVLEGIYEPAILHNLIKAMRKAGALYAGMSSAGPGFFAFADSEHSALRLQSVLQDQFGDYFSNFAVGQAGSKMSVYLD
ncbi:hypothetical protein [Methylobacter luteus]|uniref:hypothetical protein n=1 Tax=Methylobacter luteus TaxID=415 RepID=UPI0004216E7F|nr:hypothetical protein [Methylobacter luteus]